MYVGDGPSSNVSAITGCSADGGRFASEFGSVSGAAVSDAADEAFGVTDASEPAGSVEMPATGVTVRTATPDAAALNVSAAAVFFLPPATIMVKRIHMTINNTSAIIDRI